MFSIVSAESFPDHGITLRKWFIDEWQEMDPFAGPVENTEKGVIVPSPILALEDEKLIGGLAFTSAVIQETNVIGAWVNAVLVLPAYRGKGLASELIREAHTALYSTPFKALYAFTDVPILYQKLGWQVVETKGENTVVTISLP